VKIKSGIIFIIIGIICGLGVSAGKTDTLKLSLPLDTAFVQTVQCDSKAYQQFKKDKAYDYYHTKEKGDFSFWEMLRDLISRLINRQLSELTNVQLLVISIFVAVILLLIFYFFRPSWFFINKKKKMDFGVEEEDIHQLDFERLIKDALQSGRYADAIRWEYLQLLKTLHSRELISWDAHKTVIEYVYEIKQPALKSSFREATQQFLYYRYGNFEASQEGWESFNKLVNKC
jgi:hypothetical protein